MSQATQIIEAIIERNGEPVKVEYELSKESIKRLVDFELSIDVYYEWSLNETKDEPIVNATTKISFKD